MTWRAGLAGELPDIQAMAFIFAEGDPKVGVGADDSHVLESSTLDSFDNAAAVKAETERCLELMNGVMRALDASAGLVRLTGRFWESGTPHLVVVPIAAHGRATATVVGVAVATVDGQRIDPPPPAARGWLGLARVNPNVADVLKLKTGDDLGWVELTKILEIIEWDLKRTKGIVQRGWASDGQLRAFGASANLESVSGEAARHARTSGLPKKVMTLDEGRSFIQGLVQAWLAYLTVVVRIKDSC
jgi:hypothetical protein